MYSKMVNIFQRQGAFGYSGERGLKKANVGEKWKKKNVDCEDAG